ncbi:MAG: excinuclease ABC subunit UvrA [Candidatus Kapabacteria bacterium]|nr:excinuclease ABC subunit UvrA [Candidatus Kapabacteria bacterium]
MNKELTPNYENNYPISNELTHISVRGAREHNLRNINLDIPRDKFVVITGLSGSGKSSLAFDTLYAEGQRRYVECMSAYARQFLGILKKPDVDIIEGLSPAISIEQKSISHNPRSTVGTVTEIYDYIRLLFAKVGVQYCIKCNIPVKLKSLDQIISEIMKVYSEMKIQILAPLVRGRKGHYRDLFEQLQKLGYTRVRVDGEIVQIKPEMQLNRYQVHNVELIVDRCDVTNDQEQRISESVSLALKRGEGIMMILFEQEEKWKEKLFSTLNTCPDCERSYESLAPNSFSFNSPYGSCTICDGLGERMDFEESLVIPDKSLSIDKGGITAIGEKHNTWLWQQVEAYCKLCEIPLDVPIEQIPEKDIDAILYGTENTEIIAKYSFGGSSSSVYKHKFIGILPTLKHQYNTAAPGMIRRSIEEFMSPTQCSECKGGRLRPASLAVKINDKNIQDIVSMDISDSITFFNHLPGQLENREKILAEIIIKEIITRYHFLIDVGLPYLSLSRTVRTLSGGESQRIRLASQIGSQLVGIMYILDEPSIGLHQDDNYKLIDSLKKLRDLGNSVIVVEHDKSMIEESDYLVDLGPGAGVHGGELILTSSPSELKNLSKETLRKSLTAQYLMNKKSIDIPKERRKGNGKNIRLNNATGNNLKNVTLTIPLGKSVCISGKSGSGKSSLINETLYPILSSYFYSSNQKPLPFSSIEGLENVDKVIEIDQTPIGRTPRSNPATYTGLFTQIRDFFAILPESKVRGYKSGRFSFNVKGGRCEECEGAGLKKIEMNFLPEVYVNCDVCNGARYNKETLTVKYKNKSIADVLEMTVEEGTEFFSEIPKIKNKLVTLSNVGLGYIKLGQQAPTLSGGEAQRVKLATELSKTQTGKTIYLLDEPTTGLHFEDVRILLNLLSQLVDRGNTIVIIEHNLDVIKWSDWVIDLGPEGGSGGGYIIAEGTPEQICENKDSLTGKYLKKELYPDRK